MIAGKQPLDHQTQTLLSPSSAGKRVFPDFLRTADEQTLARKYDAIQDREMNRIYPGRNVKQKGFQLMNPLSYDSFRLDRYQDIVPWTHNRVQLKQCGQCDYINASVIQLEREQRYIASQGPKLSTTAHFWRMVWEEFDHSGVIVMLTKVHENGREKCVQYWPDAPNETYQDEETELKVKLEETSHHDKSDTTIRRLTLRRGSATQAEEKSIYHLQFEGWPDHAAPPNADTLISLIEIANSFSKDTKTSMIIHCSAGVGRTGTFITLDYMMRLFRRDAYPSGDPIFNAVDMLRQQRMNMVQTFNQFAFIYATCKKQWLAQR